MIYSYSDLDMGLTASLMFSLNTFFHEKKKGNIINLDIVQNVYIYFILQNILFI